MGRRKKDTFKPSTLRQKIKQERNRKPCRIFRLPHPDDEVSNKEVNDFSIRAMGFKADRSRSNNLRRHIEFKSDIYWMIKEMQEQFPYRIGVAGIIDYLLRPYCEAWKRKGDKKTITITKVVEFK